MAKTILFQGDSITDAGRSREDDNWSGVGYPTMVKGQLGHENPAKYEFLNRGISGNRVVDLYARIKSDILNLKPDYMSILIGVNDVWHELNYKNGVAADKFEKIYSMLIEEVKEALPNIKIMILEPFVLEGPATKSSEDEPDKWNIFDREVRERAKRSRAIAEKYGLTFVPLQNKFDEALKYAPTEYWLCDGVHPTAMGHNLIKTEWLKKFEEIK